MKEIGPSDQCGNNGGNGSIFSGSLPIEGRKNQQRKRAANPKTPRIAKSKKHWHSLRPLPVDKSLPQSKQ